MKFIVEPCDDKWVIMLHDMLGRRRYNNLDFDSRDDALDYLTNQFKNDNDILNSIE